MADTDWNLHSKQLVTPTDEDRMLVEPSDETAKAVEVGGFRNWLMGTALFSTLTTTVKNIIGAINEHDAEIGDIDVENDGDIAAQLNAKVNKTSIINNCNTTEEGFIADARQLKALKDYIDKLQEGTINKPYTHEEDVIGKNLLVNGWHRVKTKVDAPFEDNSHEYFVFVIKTEYFVRQIWYDLWDSNGNNTYTRQCNINNNWLWTPFAKLENN